MGYVAAALAAAFLYFQHLIGGPLFEVMRPSGPARSDIAVVSMSGDFGVNFGLTGEIAKRFRDAGVPVVAINSHDYFTTRRTPDDAAKLLSDAIDRATALEGAKRVVLVGQSYGADLMHVGLSRLPAEERAKIAAVGLVVPGRTVFFKIDWKERYDLKPPEAQAIDTARLLTWVPVICISGQQETESLCPDLVQPNVEHLAMPGGHYLKRDAQGAYAALDRFFESHLR